MAAALDQSKLTVLLVPLVASAFGWRASFLVTGAFDIVWLVLWLSFYQRPEEHKSLTDEERQFLKRVSARKRNTP